MAKFNIIAIERQYASGGRKVGKLVAQQLGIPYYGREILQMAAERNGQTADYIEHLEESATSGLFYSFMMAYKSTRGDFEMLSPEDMLLYTETEVIRDLAADGPCVMIGRSAGCILKDRKDVLRVFIYAEDEARIQRAVEQYGVPAKDAQATLRRFDKRRANFYSVNYSLKWEDKAGYHMMLDSGKLGMEACAALILEAVKG